MHETAIENVVEGSRLARAVFSTDGKLLFPAGRVLNAEAIAILRDAGVEIVNVHEIETAKEEGSGDGLPAELQETINEIVLPRFSLLDKDNEFVNTLVQVAVQREARVLLSKAGKPVVHKPSQQKPAFHTQKPPKVPIERMINASVKIGTLPVVFHRLVEIINNPYASVSDAAQIIATDPALSAKLLRLVNSPFYGLANRVDTISRAVTLIGTGQLSMLAMGATLITSFKGMPVSLVNMQSFWGHSIACGVAAKLLAQQVGLGQQERFFVAGLLHDISRLLIYTQIPTHALYLLTEAKRNNVSMHSLEEDCLGFTHEELGGELLKLWRCPEELIVKVQTHHEPFSPFATAEDAILPAANMISHGLGYGSSGELFLLSPSDNIWELLGITSDQLTTLCLNMEEKVRELRSLLAAG